MAAPLSCRAWLPASALRPGVVETLVGTIVADWSRDWLARSRLTLSGRLARAGDAATIGDETVWSVCGDRVALGTLPSARLVLARAALDAADGDAPETEADERLIDHVVRSALDDLRRRLAEIDPTPEVRWADLTAGQHPSLVDSWTGAVSLGAGHPLLRIMLSGDTVVAAFKGSLPRPSAGTNLTAWTEALRHQLVRVSARVGRAQVSLADLAGLSAGDVVVLDTPLSAPATLAIDGTARDGLRCTIERENDRFALKLLQTLEGSA